MGLVSLVPALRNHAHAANVGTTLSRANYPARSNLAGRRAGFCLSSEWSPSEGGGTASAPSRDNRRGFDRPRPDCLPGAAIFLLDTLAAGGRDRARAARVLMSAMTGDPVLCIILGANLSPGAVHSSVASVLPGHVVCLLAYAQFHFFALTAAAGAGALAPTFGSARSNPVFEEARCREQKPPH